jgi:hypothetical protein
MWWALGLSLCYLIYRFSKDVNGDGRVTISEVWAAAKTLFFLPGDISLGLVFHFIPDVAAFLEINRVWVGAVLSGIVSIAIWVALINWLDDRIASIRETAKRWSQKAERPASPVKPAFPEGATTPENWDQRIATAGRRLELERSEVRRNLP